MPKLKTKKGVAKRFSLTKTGKVKYSACSKGHLNTCKQTERLRRLRKTATLANLGQTKYIKRMLPYA
jgi:large subunit ribosomal protein L35